MSGDPQRAEIGRLRGAFPGAGKWTYMDVAGRGLLSREVRAALDDFLDSRMMDGGDKHAMLETVEATRARFANLINATPDEVAYTKNVSDGINAFANAIPWRSGDNVVLCAALEHPANLYPWYNLCDRQGIEVRTVAPRAGRLPVERLLDAVNARTRAVAVSTVSFSPGFVAPTAEIGRFCRERSVLFLVDAAQSAGILHTDVEAMTVDALALSTQKGILGLYGMGFLYVRGAVAAELRPGYLSRFGVDLGSAHEAAAGGDARRLMPGARRFDVGNYNYIAAIAANRSMEMLLSVGTRAIEDHVLELSRRLAGELHALGVPLFGGAPAADPSHIVAIGQGYGEQHDATDDVAMQDLFDFLEQNGVRLSIRRGLLRLSLHLYNNEDDVSRVVELVRRWRSATRGTVAPARG